MEDGIVVSLAAGLDPRTVELVALGLRFRWPRATTELAKSRDALLRMIEESAPDVILFEPRLPQFPLESMIEEIRGLTDAPLVVISPAPNELEMLKAFEMGADDYVADSSSPMEMSSRIFALLRRQHRVTARGRSDPITIGPLTISPSTFEAFMDDEPLLLTATEFRLLHLLSKNRGTVVANEFLERALWGDRADGAASLKKYVQRVRKKLNDDPRQPRWIRSVRGVGYRFASQVERPAGRQNGHAAYDAIVREAS